MNRPMYVQIIFPKEICKKNKIIIMKIKSKQYICFNQNKCIFKNI